MSAAAVQNGADATPVKAVYKHLDCLLAGIKGLKAAGFRDRMHVLTPFPRHEVEEMLYEGKPSPVRWFTLAGAIMGAVCGFSLAAITHANWPMILPGGKPVVSVPPFIVITFEGTILWGSMYTLVGLLLNTKLPARDLPKEMEDKRFSNDHFGIVVEHLGEEDAGRVKSILNHSGAVEVSGGTKEAAGHA